jgi:hypothetical protein
MSSAILQITKRVLAPYKTNRNTGNKYEIFTALHLLGRMGLCMEKLAAELATELAEVQTRNPSAVIDDMQKAVKKGYGLIFDGHNVVDIVNVTQDDGAGKTGDLLLVSDKGHRLSLSICGGKPKTGGKVEKCLTNPTARRLGSDEADLARIKEREVEAVRQYKEEFTQRYGVNEATWPSRVQTTVATDAAADVARWTTEKFAGFPEAKKVAIFQDLLRIDDISAKPADYLALVDSDPKKKKWAVKFYKFETPIFDSWAPSIVADGIWLKLLNNGAEIGKIQVKFNNGVYHNGKSSSLSASWNFTADLCTVFRLRLC